MQKSIRPSLTRRTEPDFQSKIQHLLSIMPREVLATFPGTTNIAVSIGPYNLRCMVYSPAAGALSLKVNKCC